MDILFFFDSNYSVCSFGIVNVHSSSSYIGYKESTYKEYLTNIIDDSQGKLLRWIKDSRIYEYSK